MKEKQNAHSMPGALLVNMQTTYTAPRLITIFVRPTGEGVGVWGWGVGVCVKVDGLWIICPQDRLKNNTIITGEP